MNDHLSSLVDIHLTLAYNLAHYLFSDYRWLKLLLIATAFDLLVTLPVTLFLKRRMEASE